MTTMNITKMSCANETCTQRTEVSAASIQQLIDELRTIGWRSLFVDYCESWYCPRCVKDLT